MGKMWTTPFWPSLKNQPFHQRSVHIKKIFLFLQFEFSRKYYALHPDRTSGIAVANMEQREIRV